MSDIFGSTGHLQGCNVCEASCLTWWKFAQAPELLCYVFGGVASSQLEAFPEWERFAYLSLPFKCTILGVEYEFVGAIQNQHNIHYRVIARIQHLLAVNDDLDGEFCFEDSAATLWSSDWVDALHIFRKCKQIASPEERSLLSQEDIQAAIAKAKEKRTLQAMVHNVKSILCGTPEEQAETIERLHHEYKVPYSHLEDIKAKQKEFASSTLQHAFIVPIACTLTDLVSAASSKSSWVSVVCAWVSVRCVWVCVRGVFGCVRGGKINVVWIAWSISVRL